MFRLLRPYRQVLVLLGGLAVTANVLTLLIPQVIASGIDEFMTERFDRSHTVLVFGSLALTIFFFSVIQSVVQTYVSELVARDLRLRLVTRISQQSFRFVETQNPSKLLTNITSDIDSIKMFVSQVIVSLVMSAVMIIGIAAILLMINWKLASLVLLIIPLIGGSFFAILKRLRPYFMQGREVVDSLNRVIRESIVGAALVRVMNSGRLEHDRFGEANATARDLGFVIVRHFAFLIPIITFVASLATLAVVLLGGRFVIQGSMSLGTFTAFLSYVGMLIFPILVVGFMSNVIAQASASYKRIHGVLEATDDRRDGDLQAALTGALSVDGVGLTFGDKAVLKGISFSVSPGSKTAIIGPTAAGKTQLLNLLAGLSTPNTGSVRYDGSSITQFQRACFFPQIGLVFQDSILFNTTMRENIAFSATATDDDLRLAVETAELAGLIQSLPNGLDTMVSERGTTLSGGQKQRVMLARALALNPRILFLDDFTARIDAQVESQILANLTRNYPDLTLVSITQKIAPIEKYDQIILLMEGEILARGTHEELMGESPEYVQIYNSQRSTNSYEVRA